MTAPYFIPRHNRNNCSRQIFLGRSKDVQVPTEQTFSNTPVHFIGWWINPRLMLTAVNGAYTIVRWASFSNMYTLEIDYCHLPMTIEVHRAVSPTPTTQLIIVLNRLNIVIRFKHASPCTAYIRRQISLLAYILYTKINPTLP